MSGYIHRFHSIFQKLDRIDPPDSSKKFATPIAETHRHGCPSKSLHKKDPYANNPAMQEWQNRKEALINAGVPNNIANFIFDKHARNTRLVKDFKIEAGLKKFDLIEKLAQIVTKIINTRVREHDLHNLQKRIADNDLDWLASSIDKNDLSYLLVISVINRLSANAFPTIASVENIVKKLNETKFLPIIPVKDEDIDRALKTFKVNLEEKTIKIPNDLKNGLGVLRLCMNEELVNKWFEKIAVKLDIPVNLRGEDKTLIMNPVFQNIIHQFVEKDPIEGGFKVIGY